MALLEFYRIDLSNVDLLWRSTVLRVQSRQNMTYFLIHVMIYQIREVMEDFGPNFTVICGQVTLA